MARNQQYYTKHTDMVTLTDLGASVAAGNSVGITGPGAAPVMAAASLVAATSEEAGSSVAVATSAEAGAAAAVSVVPYEHR